jgi:hypothetical protein
MTNIIGHIETWIAITLVALLTIFSDKILGRIRLRINRADLRVKYFEQLATDLSTYIFWVEVLHERHAKGWMDDPEDIGSIVGELNGAFTTLRIKEYVYRSWVRKYWGSDGAARFNEVLEAMKAVDAATHTFNDEGEEEQKTATLGTKLNRLRTVAERWLSETNA